MTFAICNAAFYVKKGKKLYWSLISIFPGMLLPGYSEISFYECNSQKP